MNEREINSSGSGICSDNNDDDDCNIKVPLWLIFTIASVSILLLFLISLIGCLLLKRCLRRKSKWKNHSHEDQKHGGFLHELNAKVHDSKNHSISETALCGNIVNDQHDESTNHSPQIVPTRHEDLTILHEFEQDGTVFKLMTLADETYDRLPSMIETQTPREQELISSTSDILEDNERSRQHEQFIDTETHYDDILTSSMGPARRLPTISSNKSNSLYYVYIPERDNEAIYMQPKTEQNTEYLNIIPPLSGPSQLSQCMPDDNNGSGEYMTPNNGLESTYSNILAIDHSSQVYSIPDENHLSPPNRPFRDEETYCIIEDDLCPDIYSVPDNFTSDGTNQRVSSIYTTIDDHLPAVNDEDGYSYAATHALVSPKRLQEGEVVAAEQVPESDHGYTYTTAHKLVSPESSLLGTVQESKKDNKMMQNDKIKDAPNPIYAVTPPLKVRQKSSTMPQQQHGYENLKNIKLPPRRNSDQMSFSPQNSTSSLIQHSNGSHLLQGRNKTNNELIIRKREERSSEKIKRRNSDDKDYFVDWDDWLRSRSKTQTDISDAPQQYMPIMAREMYNHKYMEPQSFRILSEKQSLSQPMSSHRPTGPKGHVSLNKSNNGTSIEAKNGIDDSDYQNWWITSPAEGRREGVSQRSKSDTLEHHNK